MAVSAKPLWEFANADAVETALLIRLQPQRHAMMAAHLRC